MEFSTDRQYDSNVPVKSVYGIVDGQNLLMDRHYGIVLTVLYKQTRGPANHPSPHEREAPQTPRERLLARLLARDFLQETYRERLLGAGGERNNQPSMGVAKVMDRTAAGEG
jgi:hypothetical protein